MEKVSIIIPAYNEEKRIKKTLEEYSKFFKNLNKNKILDYEILVVINATKDRTPEIVKKIQKIDKKIISLNLKRGGKGYAVTVGFKDALTRDNTLVGFVDADMATSPKSYYDLIKNMRLFGGVIASRYLRGSRVNPKQSVQRIMVSRIFNSFIKIILMMPYEDTQCGAKLFKREVVEKILPLLKFSKWAFDVDVLYNCKKLGIKVKEVPTTWSDQQYSKINFMKSSPFMALAIIRLRLLNSWLKGIVKYYDFLVNLFWHNLKK